ncbi:MAG: hypothetical protein M0P61_12175 [Ignavibacteriaceae bacterium]|nr:hypothetical protein [Ignavibacteriaceae bacterium]
MKNFLSVTILFFILFGITFMKAQTAKPNWIEGLTQKLTQQLIQKYGETQKLKIEKGVTQVAEFWRESDGSQKDFEDFVTANYAGDPDTHNQLFERFEYLLEQTDGHFNKLNLDYRRQADLELGPILPVDEIFAGYDPSAHINDDFFQNKIAFVVLLNFPLTTLEDRLSKGESWMRKDWAETRLAHRFAKRIPAEVNLAIGEASAKSAAYIAGYNVWMHHVLNEKGERLFPEKMRLLSHWNLRDELKANYPLEKVGLEKQRIIQKVMERIVTQTIPEIVIDNPAVDWNPFTNEVKISSIKDYTENQKAGKSFSEKAEPNTRYQMLLDDFKASKQADPYSPTAKTMIERKFNENREIPEVRVKEILESVLTSPLVKETALLIEKRLGRPLEPFDIWYNGFKPKSKYSEADLDKIVEKKYPTPQAYQKDIPNLLIKLGFTKEKAKFLASNIEVDPARGSGHAWGAGMRSEKAHLRTRVDKSGMNYKGYNIAIHEMGHNVEQTFSLNSIDHFMLQGVPNTAFTEAFAFLFQSRDLALLGLQSEDENAEALHALQDFWAVYEIAGVSLVDIEAWHWMYEHPDANAEQLKEAVLTISKNIWNKFYTPVFKIKDVVLLGIYSHMIDSFLYLPDYPLGHIISFQIDEHIKQTGNLGKEFERMATFGSVSPDVWMKHATGSPVSEKFLLDAAKKALEKIKN